MPAINVLFSLNKSFSTRIRNSVSLLKHIRQNSQKTKHITSYDLRSQVEKDVVLFKLENSKFFIISNIASAALCACWSYLGYFLVLSLKPSTFSLKGQKFWGSVLEKERKYSNILATICVIFGLSSFGGTIFYSFKSIRRIILHKGGTNVTFVTYGLPGYNTIKMPLSQASCSEHRVKAKRYIPLKLKNKFFYYLIDVQKGEFLNPQLFDFTVGLKRGF